MLYREANQYIEDFYKTSKNALLLTGARQTGKTYSARLLGKRFQNKRRGEVDFIIARGDKVMPIEVKSGKDYQKHAALVNLMKDYPDSLYDAIVLCNGNMETDVDISYVPIYMIMFIKPEESNIGVYKLDLSGLI